MEDKREIDELVKLCRQNDRKAQRIVFDKYKDAMFAICRRYAKSSAEAEDALVSGFMNVFKNIDSFSGKSDFSWWVKRVIINNCINTYESELRHNQVEKMPYLPEEIYEIESSSRFSDEELYQALNSLSERSRIIFNLIVIDGYKNSEVAQQMGMSADMVKATLYRCKMKLRNYLIELEKKKGMTI